MKVLVISANPRTDSFTTQLAQKYAEGAIASGNLVTLVHLADLDFDLNVTDKHPQHQLQEESVKGLQEKITECDHLVLVYPTWWGSFPALLKGFLDRVFTPGFGFRELNYGNQLQLLKGKSAQLITTLDTPVFVFRNFLKEPGTKAVKDATLNYCGISPVRTKYFAPVNYVSDKERQEWLMEAENMGKDLQYGFLSGKDKFMVKAVPWIKLLRLQFYPLTLLTFITGLGIAWNSLSNAWLAVLGYVVMFCIEAATVFSNEIHDIRSDVKNNNFSMFSGGSRILVNGELEEKQVQKAAYGLLAAALLLSVLMILLLPENKGAVAAIIGFSFFLGVFYTLPPFKLSHNRLGAVTVGITHGIAPLLLGYWIAGGNIFNAEMIILGAILSFSIIPGILLSGIPDYEADKETGKITEAVWLGKRNILKISLVISVVTLSALVYFYHNQLNGILSPWVYAVLIFGIFFFIQQWKLLKLPKIPERIDGLMVYALLFMFLTGLVPFLKVIYVNIFD